MPAKKNRPSRLGRGLSGLMGPAAQAAPAAINQPPESSPPVSHPGAAAADSSAPPLADTIPAQADPVLDGSGEGAGMRYLRVSDIQPNRYQPRQVFPEGSLRSLSDSIKAEGVMQPIVVRPINEGGPAGYELIAGERRWRASQLAEIQTVPAIIREMGDEQTAQWALVENLQREDLNPIDKAEAFQSMSDSFGISHAEIAKRVGLERSTVSNLIRLLALSDFVKGLVREDLLSMGQSRAIAGLPDANDQKALAQRAVREGLSVRQVEAEVSKLLKTSSVKQPSSKAIQSAHLADLEKQLAEQLGTRVKLKAGKKKGSGSMAIEFYSLDQFDALLERMGVKAS